MFGEHLIKTWSLSQQAYALSSAEAQFYAMVEAVGRGGQLAHLAPLGAGHVLLWTARGDGPPRAADIVQVSINTKKEYSVTIHTLVVMCFVIMDYFSNKVALALLVCRHALFSS